MTLALLLFGWLAATAPDAAATSQEPAASPVEAPAAASQPAGSEHGSEPAPAGAAGHAATAADHEGPAAVLMHHVVDQRYGHLYAFGLDLGPTKHLVFFLVAATIVLVWVRAGLANYRNGLPGKLASSVEALVIFIRDEIAEKNIGHDGRKFVPLLCSFFFFILVAAIFGLMPFSATSTGNIAVTLGLATISFAAQQYAGISKYGLVHHFTAMVPPGLPFFLLPIMVPIELLGMFTKPFALMVRLFANMLAGHMVITTLLLLIPLMAKSAAVLGIFMIPVSLGLSLFIMLLELLVAFIQAYIFTLLSAIFIGMYAHPAH